MPTHEVINQPPPFPEVDLYAADPVLADAVKREGGGWADRQLRELGSQVGSAEVAEWGFLANRYEPVLQTHDRFGNRIDQIEFHPAWHSLMEMSISHGVHSVAYEEPGREGSHVARGALMYLDGQAEQGHSCPISMTASVLPSLRRQPEVAAAWEPLVLSRRYDPAFAPAKEKGGVLFGMGMTEKQGGSDVRANTTTAEPINGGGPGAEYRITGHKWFTSAPMCDAFLVLANSPGGLSCFLLPRWKPDRTVNAFHLQRLKDKLGNRSNASAEAEFEAAWAVMVGAEGRGVATIMEMVSQTRLDCLIGSAALMRQAVYQAAHHVAYRSAFGGLLADKPLMRNVIADLEVDTEAATLIMARVTGAFDRAHADPAEAALKRLLTPVAKYWVTKSCTGVVREAMECLGGAGYVEESVLPRLFRESPLNSIWEGSGNVIALDVLRAMNREPAAVDVLLEEVRAARGVDRNLDGRIGRLDRMLTSPEDAEWTARRLVEAMALAVQGSLVVRYGSAVLADTFCATRLGDDWGRLYGTLPAGLEVSSLVAAAAVD